MSDRVCRCGHDDYDHGAAHSRGPLPRDSVCDKCSCSRFTPPPEELDVLLGVPSPPR